MKSQIKDFYNSFSFIIAFMILVMLFEMLLGEKVTQAFLILVMASMAIFNADKVENIFGGIQKEV